MYTPPPFLQERHASFSERWALRDQFEKIIYRMETVLKNLEEKKEKIRDKVAVQVLIEEVKNFRVWSWKEADMDEEFYNTIQQFDRRAFQLLQDEFK